MRSTNLQQTRSLTRRLLLLVLALVVVLLALPLAGAVGGQGKGTDLSTLPKEVQDAVKRAGEMYSKPLDGATWKHVYKMEGSKHPVYQLQGTNGRGNLIEMEVTSAGRIIEVEEHGISADEVPAAVLAALKAKMPDFKPAVNEAIYQMGHTHPVAFGFETKEVAGKKTEVYISADGKTFLNK